MNLEAIKEILNPVIIFLSSSVGATVIGVLIRTVINAVANLKTKKYSRLTVGERESIAGAAADKVLDAVKGGLNIEADALLDKYTNGRVSALEERYNALIESVNTTQKYMRSVLAAVGDFRTISAEHKTDIQSLLKDPPVEVESVRTIPAPTVTVTAPASEKKTVARY